jgi:hypothetical protein
MEVKLELEEGPPEALMKENSSIETPSANT